DRLVAVKREVHFLDAVALGGGAKLRLGTLRPAAEENDVVARQHRSALLVPVVHFVRLHEVRHDVGAVIVLVDFVEVVHPAGELVRDGTAGPIVVLLETGLALLALRGGWRAEVGAAAAAGRVGARAAEAAPRSGTAKAAAWPWAAESAARTAGPGRIAAAGP